MTILENVFKTTQADLDLLISERAPEGPHLDFKRELPATWNEKAKQDLIADASAFANSGGGDILYGMDEDDDGCAKVLVPQQFNQDDGAVQIQNILRDTVEPRMPGCQVHPVKVNVNGIEGFAVVVRVPQSWARPHRVKTNQHFYFRDGKQKRPLDVPEIRGMFLRSEGQAQRVLDFRTERIARILTGETPRPLANGVAIVLHLVPTQAALGAMQVDPLQYDTSRFDNARRLPVLGNNATGNPRITLDGMAYVRPSNDSKTYGYSLMFRNGFFEAVAVYDSVMPGPRNLIGLWHQEYENNCIRLVEKFREELKALDVPAEMTVMLSILNADKGVLNINRMNYSMTADEGYFDRKHVILPNERLDADVSVDKGLQSC